MIKLQKFRNIFLTLALLSVVSLVSYKFGESRTRLEVIGSGADKMDLSMMWKVKDRLNTLFLEKDKLQDKEMTYGAIEGMVAALGDPYTVYLPPKNNKSANEDLAGEFGGVGISLGYKDSNLAVMTALPKTPAEKANLQAGDLILKITDKAKNIDKDTAGLSLNEAVDLIRGKIGTEVTLKMYRESNKQPFEVTLKRENIIVPSLEMEWVDSAKASTTEKKIIGNKKIAWVKLYKFSDRLNTEWTEVVNQINSGKNSGNYGGIVLDLRNNPGGYLQVSVMVASDFLKEGVVVSQESNDGKKEDYVVDKTQGRLLNDKMVVLVNGGSASAAEILAGALKEYGRAKLVGEKTFGKGTVQQPENFSDGSGLHVTIAKWLLPNGKNIHKVGVEPDVGVKYEVPITPTGTPADSAKSSVVPMDNQLDKAMEELLKS